MSLQKRTSQTRGTIHEVQRRFSFIDSRLSIQLRVHVHCTILRIQKTTRFQYSTSLKLDCHSEHLETELPLEAPRFYRNNKKMADFIAHINTCHVFIRTFLRNLLFLMSGI